MALGLRSTRAPTHVTFVAFAVLVLLACSAACGGKGQPRSRTVAKLASSARAVEDRRVPASLDRTIVGAPTSYRLRAAEFPNLFYQLDCLAGITRCSRAAYEDLWQRPLGGLDDADRAALTGWKKLRDRYRGSVLRQDEDIDVGLPVPRPHRAIAARVRLAGYAANTPAEYAQHLALFDDPADVADALAIVRRFAPRFERWWLARSSILARSIDGYEKIFARADVQETLRDVARFYRTDLPSGHVMEVELIARPDHDSPTSGEVVGLVSVVEVMDGEPAEERFPIIVHEMFHAWFGLGPYADGVALARRFSSSTDADALAAAGLLDEVLATMNGNGRIGRIVSPKQFAKRMAQPEGLYNDRFIDGVAKAMLRLVDERPPGTESVFADAFLGHYLAAVHAAFPTGLPPVGRLRRYLCLYDKELQGAYEKLADATRPSSMYSDETLDATEAREVLARRVAWPLVLLVPSAKLDVLRGWGVEIDKVTAGKIAQRARVGKTFVIAARRPSRADLFVFVAPDDASMTRLVETFAAQDKSFDVLLPPAALPN